MMIASSHISLKWICLLCLGKTLVKNIHKWIFEYKVYEYERSSLLAKFLILYNHSIRYEEAKRPPTL